MELHPTSSPAKFVAIDASTNDWIMDGLLEWITDIQVGSNLELPNGVLYEVVNYTQPTTNAAFTVYLKRLGKVSK